VAGTLWASDDPFCGKWKLNMEKSKLVGEQIKIQDLGGNKYKWTSGNTSDTFTYDGTDQPARFGRTHIPSPRREQQLEDGDQEGRQGHQFDDAHDFR
jgi:hypothetical protein